MKSVLSLLVSFFLFSAGMTASAADVGGIIESDTLLNADSSPYLVTGNILIRQNVKLEIEPGVTVKFRGSPISSSGYYIRVDGTLNAQGTEEKPILFTAENVNQPWGCIAFTNSSTDWNDKSKTGSVLSHCIIEYAGNGQDASVLCVSASPFITDTAIRNGSTGGIRTSGGFQRILSNRIYGNGYGIRLSCQGAWIENNFIENNRQQGIYLDSSTYKVEIINNTIIGSAAETDGNCLSIALYYNSDTAADTAASEAVTAANAAAAEAKSAQDALANAGPDNYSEAYFAADTAVKAAKAAADKATAMLKAAADKAAELTADIQIHKNHIISKDGNSIAINEQAANANYKISLTENNIENINGKLALFLYNWKHESPEPFDMTGNWWGTADTAQIGQMIYDAKNDFYLPKVNYQPVAAEKISDAGSSLTDLSPEEDESDLPGIIAKDTVWTLEGSPYIITGNILIKEGVKLEIMPGVTVKFSTAAVQSVGHYIQVDGTLNAQGTENSPILFTAEDPARTWGCIAFTDTSTDWNETSGSGSILSHCILEYAGNSQEGGKKDFGGGAVLCFSASPMIKDSMIRNSAGDAIRASGKDLKIINNIIADNAGMGIFLSADAALIENNYLVGNVQGIYLDSCTERIQIQDNTVIGSQPQTYGSCISIVLYYHLNPADIAIRRNIITNKGNGNAVAATTSDASANDSLGLTENSIENQGSGLAVYLYNWQPQNPKAISMTENWWGTGKSDEVARMIYDAKNDFYLPKISYLPIAAEPPANAGSDLSYPPPDDETEQPGVIARDTIWTLAESPYIISGNILIKQNAGLTIEPGVTVKFRTAPVQSVGYYIRVDGTLNAEGTPENPILFTSEDSSRLWGCIVFTETSTGYDETTSGGCVLSHCIIEYAGNSQDGGVKDYGKAGVLCISASPLISNNTIRYIGGDAIRAFGGTQSILGNYIHDNTRGIYIASERGVIADNYLSANAQGIFAGSCENSLEIRSNTIESNSSEVSGACLSINLYYHLSPSEIRIYKNHLISTGTQANAVGVSAQSPDANDILSLTENNIENRGNLSLYFHDWQPQNPKEIPMSDNWWGSTDSREIDRMIYDAENDFYLPKVNYQPFATEKIQDAGSTLSPALSEDAGQPGVIAEDTVWTIDNSPYMVSGNLRIGKNVKLEIEPGVAVIFKSAPIDSLGYYIEVEGTLKAEGEKDRPILFTAEDPARLWGCIVFAATSTDCILSRCIIEYAGNPQDAGLKDYGGVSVLCLSASPLITDNIIRKSGGDGISAQGGSLTILNNRIHQVSRAMNMLSSDVRIENNYLIYNQQGISLSAAGNRIFLKNNSIISNSAVTSGACLGITLYPDNTLPEIEIYRNHILSRAGNAVAIAESQGMSANYELKIRENNIENIGGNLSVYLYNWQKYGQSLRLDMSDCWWGTADTAEIGRMIFDSDNDFYLPEVQYEPFAPGLIPGAWSVLLYPPIANAGTDLPGDPNQPVYGDMTVPLDASNSFDPDKKMSYHWIQTGGPGVTLKHADSVKAEFVTPSVTSDNAVLTFQLRVKDPEGFYDTDSVSITVTPGGPVKMERDKGQCFIGTAGSGFGVRDSGFGWLLLIVYLIWRKAGFHYEK